MKSDKSVRHNQAENVSADQPTVGDDLRAFMSELEKIMPRNGLEQAVLFKALLHRINASLHYFKEAPLRERKELRRLTPKKERLELGLAATEARQLLRDESNYQDYIKQYGTKYPAR